MAREAGTKVNLDPMTLSAFKSRGIIWASIIDKIEVSHSEGSPLKDIGKSSFDADERPENIDIAIHVNLDTGKLTSRSNTMAEFIIWSPYLRSKDKMS